MGDQNIPLATFVLSYVGTRAGFALAKDYSRRNWSPEAASLVDPVARSSVMSPGAPDSLVAPSRPIIATERVSVAAVSKGTD